MKSLAPPSLYVDTVTIIVPVKDEEEGLSYLLDDFEKSDLKNISNKNHSLQDIDTPLLPKYQKITTMSIRSLAQRNSKN